MLIEKCIFLKGVIIRYLRIGCSFEALFMPGLKPSRIAILEDAEEK